MIPNPLTMIIPLQTDTDGNVRVKNSRVTLDVLIARYQQGLSPEQIHNNFSTVSLDYIYAIIAYYLANREEVDQYLARQKAEAKRVREEIEGNYPPAQKQLTDRLRKLAQEKREQSDT